MKTGFVFEKLDVYQRALEFARIVHTSARSSKAPRSWTDQFVRAATSVVLNIAEGAGRIHKAEKRNFYYIAKGSTFECVPLIELGLSLGVLDDTQRNDFRSTCLSIAQMLTKLIQSVEKQA